jgi:predicted GNAT superfamily acetyltransferase
MTPADMAAADVAPPGSSARPQPATDLGAGPPLGGLPPATVDAVDAAEAVAGAAGLRVRSLVALPELEAVQRLYERIWRPAGTSAPVTTELLRALSKAGSYVGGAFDGPELVGACIGFFGTPSSVSLHSHIAGVAPRAQGRNVGFALKVHQRAWALLQGIREIAWTFDPLIARNAYFNVAKLAADPVEYLPNFYGRMNDGINGTDETDRLLVSWRLDAVAVAEAGRGRHRLVPPAVLRGAPAALAVSASGAPVPASHPRARTVLVAVPADIEALRLTDPALATAWRAALRDVLGGLLADGARVRGFDRAGAYVVERPDMSENRKDQP